MIDLDHTCAIINHIRSEINMPDLDQKALAPQRWDNLRALIRDSGVIRIEDLCRQLKVSPATVRRDLDQLEQSGAIRRVHGGAVSVESRLDEPVFADKTSLAVREKRRIAEAALAFVEPGDTILSGRRQHGAGTGAPAARADEPDGGDQFAARRPRAGRARAATDRDRRRVAAAEPDDGGAVDAAGAARTAPGQGVHGHHRICVQRRADDHRPERGVHQGSWSWTRRGR